MNPSTATLIAFFCLECAVLGCPPGPVVPTPDADAIAPPQPEAGPVSFDSATTSVCYRGCQALAAAGCAEGSSILCVTRLQTINDARTERNPAHGNLALTCDDVAGVKSAADVAKIGQKCSVLDAGH